jgi:hypothetical protein
LDKVAELYGPIIVAGIRRASFITVAEAANFIKNTQRDLNIAMMKGLALIFDRIGIEPSKLLQATGTKLNFLPFRLDVVGGNCIRVDLYYLTHKAAMLGYRNDPLANSAHAKNHHGVSLSSWEDLPPAVEAIVATGPHRNQLTMPRGVLLSRLKRNEVFIGVKSAPDYTAIREAGFRMCSL